MTEERKQRYAHSPQWNGDSFVNPVPTRVEFNLTDVPKMMHERFLSNVNREHDILKFMQEEFEPVMAGLENRGGKVLAAIQSYKEVLHGDLGFVYNHRRSFDESVNKVNGYLASYLDSRQDEAQAMYPHYFERYKTDGVEFNMYIGSSITPEQPFDRLLVKNLRLWQLMTMVEMEWEFKKLQETLDKPLDIASLILAFSTPLSIQFRMDEKHFDVEGAYNARYEIIKKRIDKAHIKGTPERITKPGSIVVVYTSEEDEREYLRYFDYLQSKGYLAEGGIEVLDVEDLQGVTGLKALRMTIDFGNPEEEGLTMEEIIAEIEGQEL